MDRPTRPKYPKAGPLATQQEWDADQLEHLAKMEAYADAIDQYHKEMILPVLRDHKDVFQRAIDTMPQDSIGALALIIDQHKKRIEIIDDLIIDLEDCQDG